MSVHVCHGDWFKHNVLKVNHLAGLTVTTAMGSKLCLSAKRHKNILMYHSLSMAGSTVAFIRYREDKGPSRGINSTCLSERRDLAFLLAVTDCWVFLISKRWAWPSISNTYESGRKGSKTTSVFSDALSSFREDHLYLDVTITWLEGLWLSLCCERPQEQN